MSRGLDSSLAAALAAAHVTHFLLIELQLDSGTLRLTTAPLAVAYGGHSWLTVHPVGAIESIEETSSEQRGLSFTLSGVPASIVSTVLNEPVQGRFVKLRLVVLDGETLRVDENAWTGLLDTLTLEDKPDGAVVKVNAEHRFIAWREPNLVRYSHEDQQRLAPGDEFFSHAAAISQAEIVWPAKEFFKQ
jgi:hypothetical protein